jgi:L-fuconolactonase
VITDAQVHLWEDDRPDRPMAADAKPHLPYAMTAERMLALMDEAGIDRAVISPLYLPNNGAEYALEVAAKYPDRFKVMGWFQPEDPNALPALETWLDQPGMCSIRLSLNDEKRTAMLTDGTLAPFFTAAERLGIPVAVFRFTGIAPVEPIVQQHPNLTVIVDHLNMPRNPDEREQKMSELETFANYPNVYVKVSALPLFADPPYGDLQPMIKRVHAAYGPQRLMWGSDQTQQIARDRATYRENLDIIAKDAAAWLPPGDLDWILNGTASKVFNWPS